MTQGKAYEKKKDQNYKKKNFCRFFTAKEYFKRNFKSKVSLVEPVTLISTAGNTAVFVFFSRKSIFKN